MFWKEKIKQIGMANVAKDLGVTHAAVRRYVHGGSFPGGKKMKSLVAMMFRELSQDDFIKFVNSLSEDIMGVSTSSVQDSQAG